MGVIHRIILPECESAGRFKTMPKGIAPSQVSADLRVSNGARR